VRPPAWSLFLSVLLASCGSGVRYADTLPLSGTVFTAGGGRLTGTVPEGWTSDHPRGGGLASAPVVLDRGDSLRIVIRELGLDAAAAVYYGETGPGELAVLNRTLRDTSYHGRAGGIGRFSLNGRDYAVYELSTATGKTRVALFGAGGAYFECEAVALRRLSGEKSYDRLFAFQQTLLRSLK